MARTVFWISWMFLYFIGRLPVYWRAKRLQRQGHTAEADALVCREVTVWSQKLLAHVKTTVVVTGRENLPPPGEAVVFVANHQSYVDIPVLLANLDAPHPLLAKKELGQVPLLGLWMKALGCVLVDRDDARAAMASLRRCEALVEAGKSIIVFPEGTRSKSPAMGEFKAGAMHVAAKAGAPVVPVAISGSYRSLEGNGFKLQKNTVHVAVLPAVPTQALGRAEQKALPARLADAIAAAQAADGHNETQ